MPKPGTPARFHGIAGEVDHTTPERNLLQIAIGLLAQQEGVVLTLKVDDLDRLPETPPTEDARERKLLQLKAELQALRGQTTAQSNAAAAAAHARETEHYERTLAHFGRAAERVGDLFVRVRDWRPVHADPVIQIKLEAFQAKLALELATHRLWYATNVVPPTQLSGEEYRRRQIAGLEAEITIVAAAVAEFNAGTAEDLPFFAAVRDGLKGLFPDQDPEAEPA